MGKTIKTDPTVNIDNNKRNLPTILCVSIIILMIMFQQEPILREKLNNKSMFRVSNLFQ